MMKSSTLRTMIISPVASRLASARPEVERVVQVDVGKDGEITDPAPSPCH